jgi:hypothetical protein
MRVFWFRPGLYLTPQEPCQSTGCVVWEVKISRLENAERGGMPVAPRRLRPRLWSRVLPRGLFIYFFKNILKIQLPLLM